MSTVLLKLAIDPLIVKSQIFWGYNEDFTPKMKDKKGI